MKITKAEYMSSAISEAQFPQSTRPEIVFVGRSNVGKSSLINMLVERKKLAYFSQRPGKTQTINFYNVNDTVTFVDVPGYGYAKVPTKQRAVFAAMMEAYFTIRKQCALVCLLLDIRRNPSIDDEQMLTFLHHYRIPLIILFTKVDKLSNNQQNVQLKHLKACLDIDGGTTPFVLTSAATDLGKDKAWSEIFKKIKDWEKGRIG